MNHTVLETRHNLSVAAKTVEGEKDGETRTTTIFSHVTSSLRLETSLYCLLSYSTVWSKSLNVMNSGAPLD